MCADRYLAVAALTVLLAGCAAHDAPRGFLPDPREAQTDTYGGWIELTVLPDSATVEGELVAIDEDSIRVLSLAGGARTVATGAVVNGKLVAYDAELGRVAVATIFGTASTLSNGMLLIITAPLTILTSTIAGARHSHAPVHEVHTQRWSDLAPFARFPQGMPDGLTIEELRPRPVRENPLRPAMWFSVGAGTGSGGDVRLLGVGLGAGRWTVRGRYLRMASDAAEQTELGVLIGFRPPQIWKPVVYDVAVGYGRASCPYWAPPCQTTGYGEGLHGLALSLGAGLPETPEWVGLRLELFGHVNEWRSFAGFALSVEVGLLPR